MSPIRQRLLQVIEHTPESNEEQRSKKLAYCLMMGILFSILLILFSFRSLPADINCTRTSMGIQCTIIRHTSFLNWVSWQTSPINMINPTEVSIRDLKGKGSHSLNRQYYIAELKATTVPYKIRLVDGYDFQKVQSVARKINDFLISSNASTLTIKYPDG
jgi:hypothetical protein